MSMDEYKQTARESLETLYEIEEIIESALADSDEYWTWAGFFNDKKGEIMPIKDDGQQAVQQLQDSVEAIRESLADGELSDVFDRLDRNKQDVRDVVDEIREFAGVKAAIMEGEKLVGLLETLLDRFRETSDSVETLLEKLEKSGETG